MGAMWGADPAQLDLLGTQIRQAVATLDRNAAHLTSLLGGAMWAGPDADRFRGEWSGQYAPAIARASTALTGAATALDRQATLQREASAATGPAVPSGPTVGTVVSMVDRYWTDLDKGVSVGTSGGTTVGPQMTWSGAATLLGLAATGSASLFATAGWNGSASAGISAQGADASASIGASAELGASAQANWGNAFVSAGASGTAEIGANASGSGDLHLGLDGLDASAQASAFAGGQASGSVSGDLLGLDGSASGGVDFGIGAAASASGSLTTSDVGFSVHLSAALGLGLNGSLSVHVDPDQVVHEVGSFSGGVIHEIEGFSL